MKQIDPQVREALESILLLEESEAPDWAQIEKLSEETLCLIHSGGLYEDLDDSIYHFVEDYDVRQKSISYANGQRRNIKRLLSGIAG